VSPSTVITVLLFVATILISYSAQSAPFSTTRYVRVDTSAHTGHVYDEAFRRLPENPVRPGTGAELLPTEPRWFLGADVDMVRRRADGSVELVSHRPSYSQLNHHVIWHYVTDSRPAKDPCGILPLAGSRDLLDLRFPGGYAFKVHGGRLGVIDWHWTNSADIPSSEEVYVRFIMHWDDASTGYRDMHVTWVGLNPCQEEVYLPHGETEVQGQAYKLGEDARIVAVAPHTKDHVEYIELRRNSGAPKKLRSDTLWRYHPEFYRNRSAHFGNNDGSLSVPLHRHRMHIPEGGLSLWLPGLRGPVVKADDALTSYALFDNPHHAPIENSSIFLVFWEPIATSKKMPDVGMPTGPEGGNGHGHGH
jgi:hypothetical protein